MASQRFEYLVQEMYEFNDRKIPRERCAAMVRSHLLEEAAILRSPLPPTFLEEERGDVPAQRMYTQYGQGWYGDA